MACLGVALFLGAVSVPLVKTLVGQIRLMIPWRTSPSDRAFREISQQFRADGAIRSVLEAVQRADRRSLAEIPDRWRQADPHNGLYAYLELLPMLPAERGTAGSRAADVPDLPRRVLAVADGPPVRLYGQRRWDLAVAALRDTNEDAREAAHRADGLMQSAARRELAVIRRLVRGLRAQSRQWRETGRPSEARMADAAAARLLLDLVEESRRPETVLLACRHLPGTLSDLSTSAADPDQARQLTDQAHRIAAIRSAWHQRSPRDAVNLLPANSDFLRAPAAHERVLRSMLAAVCGAITWAVLGVACLFFLPLALLSWRRAPAVRWRWGGRGRWAVIVLGAGPLLVVMLWASLVANHTFTWIVSAGTLTPVLFLPSVVFLLIGLGSWLCIEWTPAEARGLLPKAAWLAAGVIGAAVLVLLLFYPASTQPWRPPPAVQYLRRAAFALGSLSLVFLIAGAVWGTIRRRSARIPYARVAAGRLAIAAWVWPFIAGIALGALAVNQRFDAQHRAAFLAASADPLTDRLGPGWSEAFQDARTAVSGVARPEG